MKLGDISPLAGMLTGEGATGKLMAKGFGGILPAAIARNAQKDKEEEAAVRAGAARSMKGAGMKKGGVTRADGCITKGHTRGKMV
jgi:hypothetical protein